MIPTHTHHACASAQQLALLRNLLAQKKLTEEDLPLLLTEIDRDWASRLIRSLEGGRIGFPHPCPVNSQTFRVLFLTYRAIHDGNFESVVFSPALFMEWSFSNKKHSDAMRRLWMGVNPHGTPGRPFHLQPFSVRQELAKALLNPMTTKLGQLSRLLWTEAGFELYKTVQC